MPEKIALSIVTPMFNEQENVERTASLISEAMKNFNGGWELIMVNDGSTDSTLEAAKKLEEKMPQLRVLSYQVNRGRGKALRTGFAAARGDIVVSTDFDLSYSPDHILRIYNEFQNSPDTDVVLGSAYMPGGTVQSVPFVRHAASRLGNMVLSFAMGRGLHTITCILRGYRRSVLETLDLESDGKEIHLEILSKVLAIGFRVKEIPADLRGRISGKSKFKLKTTSATHLVFSFFERPMLLFGGIGFLLIITGLIFGAAVVFMRFSGTLNPERPLMTLIILLVLAGIQILSLGFLSLQVLSLRKEIYRIQGQNKLLHKSLKNLERSRREDD